MGIVEPHLKIMRGDKAMEVATSGIVPALESASLSEGVIIEGFKTPEHVDVFFDVVARHMLPEDGRDDPHAYVFRNGADDAKPFSRQLKEQVWGLKHPFNGNIRDLAVIALPSNVSTYQSRPVEPTKAFQFVVEGDLQSTGRGSVGQVYRIADMFVDPTRKKKSPPFVVQLRTRPHALDVTIQQINGLHDRARGTFQIKLLEGMLKRPITVGGANYAYAQRMRHE